MHRHMLLAISLMASLLFVSACSMFTGASADQQDAAAQTRNDQLRSDMKALKQSLKNQKAQLALPPDAQLWVRIPFDSGHATVKEATHKVLHDLVAKYRTLEAYDAKQRVTLEAKYRSDPHHRVLFVQGFCDNEPVGGYDGSHIPPAHHYKSLLALSEARAVAVAEILMQSGIPHEEIQIQAFGASHFIGRNSSDSERQKNRRVDVFLAER